MVKMSRRFREWFSDVVDDISYIEPEDVLVAACLVFGLVFILFTHYEHKIKTQQEDIKIARIARRCNQKVKAAESDYKHVMQHKPYVTVKQAVNNYNKTVKKAGADFTGYDKLYTVVDDKNGQEYFFSRGHLTNKGNTVINKAWQKEHRK